MPKNYDDNKNDDTKNDDNKNDDNKNNDKKNKRKYSSNEITPIPKKPRHIPIILIDFLNSLENENYDNGGGNEDFPI